MVYCPLAAEFGLPPVPGRWPAGGVWPGTGLICNSLLSGWETDIGNPGLDDHLWLLLAVDEGEKLAAGVYACGDFETAGGKIANHIARWDGSEWQVLAGSSGTGADGAIETMVVGPDGNLYVGGAFTHAGGIRSPYFAMWDGSEWNAVTTGGSSLELNGFVLASVVTDVMGPTQIWVGGWFTGLTPGYEDVFLQAMAYYDGAYFGTNWPDEETACYILALHEQEDVNGKNLYVGSCGGQFGGVSANMVTRFDGYDFHPMGSGVLDGAVVYAFRSWQPPGGSDSLLYAGGLFSDMDGVADTYGIASWNGSEWSDVGGGVTGGSPYIEGLAVANLSNTSGGERLFATGAFEEIGGKRASGIAAWNGSQWARLGRGFDPLGGLSHGMAIVAWTHEGKTCLYAGGPVDFAGGDPIDNIARYCRG